MASSPTDYDLDLGKIMDTLQSDYRAFFQRPPNFEIYHDRVVLEIRQPLDMASGKRAYCRALRALQGLASNAIRNGTVHCRVCDGKPYGHAVRVHWTCEGNMIGLQSQVHISAISLYSLAREAQQAEAKPLLLYKVQRHVIDSLEIHPPSLRSLLCPIWWQQLQSGPEPLVGIGRL